MNANLDSQNPTSSTTDADEIARMRDCLESALHSGDKLTTTHLAVIEENFSIENTRTTLHCFAPKLDSNGRLRTDALAEFLLHKILNFVIPRSKAKEALRRIVDENDPSVITRLFEQAKSTFNTAKNSGEGGETLLYALAEKELELTQLLCKMSLKTSTNMYYHGSDGVFASIDDDGFLNLFWGESKLYDNPTSAITDCVKSLAPHLKDEPGSTVTSRDIHLLNEYADLDDSKVEQILKRFLDADHPDSHKLRICGIALVTFDDECFPNEGEIGGAGKWTEVEAALKAKFPKWSKHIQKRIAEDSIDAFDIHFICVPMSSADSFRQLFFKKLGISL